MPFQVKQEPEEVDEEQQLPGALSKSEPAPTGGTLGEGTPGSQPPVDEEVGTSSVQPAPRDVSTFMLVQGTGLPRCQSIVCVKVSEEVY